MSLSGRGPSAPSTSSGSRRDVTRYQDRHRVKSGITGWAQVNGLRGQTSIADRVEWDNYYIQNWSLRLDLRIVMLTIAEMSSVPRRCTVAPDIRSPHSMPPPLPLARAIDGPTGDLPVDRNAAGQPVAQLAQLPECATQLRGRAFCS